MRLLPVLLLGACSEFALSEKPGSEPTTTDTGTPYVPVTAPVLRITPSSHDFGTGQLDCPLEVTVTLENVGTADLELLSVTFDGDQMALAALDDRSVLAPGEQALASIVYSPTTSGGAWGRLDVDSTDPDGPQQADQFGDTAPPTLQVDAFEVEDPPVDLLFAVDQSGSMADDQARLAGAFDMFILGLSEITGDWQLGVVTLDDGCLNHGILLPTTPDLTELFTDAVSDAAGATAYTEALLQLAAVAVDAAAPGGCNEGLLRPGAALHIVLVSDEHEQSGDPAAHLDAILLARPAAKVSAVVDVDHVCGDPIEGGPYGYDDAVARTGGLLLDICDDAWGDRAPELAAASVSGEAVFLLTAPVVPGTLEVFFDGVPATRGWTLDVGRNALVVADASLVHRVEAAYRVALPCE
ncbi:MAG: hypothetical protein ACI8PZ_003821 [Myxococcota bacterium]|jgi:hypothetical protein